MSDQEQIEIELTEIKAELKRWLDQRLKESFTQGEKSLQSAVSSSSQNPGLEKRIERLEAEIKAIRPAVEKLAKMVRSHD